MKKIGLVLEGGAMRGIFTSAVLDMFLEENINVDGIIGVSAGALFGVNYPSKQPGRGIRYNLKYLHNKNYLSWYSFFKTGNLLNKEFAFYEIPNKLDPLDNETFKKSGIDFYIVITNVATGQAEYIKITDPLAQMEDFRATGAMPFVSKMVEINGQEYLDGGIADSIPIKKCEEMGYDKIIVVLTRPKGYRKKEYPELAINLFYHQHPELAKAIIHRYKNYNESMDHIEKLEEEGKIFVIRPSEDLNIGRIEKDPKKLQALYNLGIKDTKNNLNKLEQYLT